MKLSETKEYQDFLSVLKNVENEGLRVVLEDALFEVILKSWEIGYDVCYLKGFERGKDFKNA